MTLNFFCHLYKNPLIMCYCHMSHWHALYVNHLLIYNGKKFIFPNNNRHISYHLLNQDEKTHMDSYFLVVLFYHLLVNLESST
jgi:uncharacterized protein YprB with RNaseH-like and TPR domain